MLISSTHLCSTIDVVKPSNTLACVSTHLYFCRFRSYLYHRWTYQKSPFIDKNEMYEMLNCWWSYLRKVTPKQALDFDFRVAVVWDFGGVGALIENRVAYFDGSLAFGLHPLGPPAGGWVGPIRPGLEGRVVGGVVGRGSSMQSDFGSLKRTFELISRCGFTQISCSPLKSLLLIL